MHACCKRIFEVVSGVLQVFHMSVACVCNGFQVFFMCFCKCFRRMFQVFHLSSLYVATVAYGCFKIRSGLHVGCTWKAAGGAGNVWGCCGPAPQARRERPGSDVLALASPYLSILCLLA
jgi:hypothetical protein